MHNGEEAMVEFFDKDDEDDKKDMTDEAQILSVNKSEICIFKPLYDAQGKIQGIRGCDKLVAVFNNAMVEMTIVYDLSKHTLYPTLFSLRSDSNISWAV